VIGEFTWTVPAEGLADNKPVKVCAWETGVPGLVIAHLACGSDYCGRGACGSGDPLSISQRHSGFAVVDPEYVCGLLHARIKAEALGKLPIDWSLDPAGLYRQVAALEDLDLAHFAFLIGEKRLKDVADFRAFAERMVGKIGVSLERQRRAILRTRHRVSKAASN